MKLRIPLLAKKEVKNYFLALLLRDDNISAVVFEEITHLLQKEEGAPISAVLIDVGTQHATATLLRAGRVVETKETILGESIPSTIDDLLKTFDSSDILPSRILLFNVGGSSKLAQQFISHQWSKSLPFLHVPQITLLETDFEARAILFGTAAQLGFETIDLEKKSDRKTISTSGDRIPEDINLEPEEDGSAHSAGSPLRASFAGGATKAEQGFEGQAVSPQAEEVKEKVEGNDIGAEYFGFSTGRDVLQNTENKFSEIPENVKEEETYEGTKSGGFPLQIALIGEGMRKVLSSLKRALPTNLFAIFPRRKQDGEKRNFSLLKNPFLLLTIVLLLIIGGGISWYMMAVEGSVVLIVQPKVIDQEKDVSFSTSTPSDFANNVLSGQSTTIDEDGQ